MVSHMNNMDDACRVYDSHAVQLIRIVYRPVVMQFLQVSSV